jgi:CBS domain-containing protein
LAASSKRRRCVSIVGNDGELVGVLTVDDVVDHLALQLGRIADIIRFEQEMEVDERP